MKRIQTLVLGLLVTAAASLSSCSSARYFDFTTASHRATSVAAVTPAPAPEAEAAAAPVVAAEPVLEASTAAQPVAPAPVAQRAAAKPAAPAALSTQLESARAEQQFTRAQERRYERVLRKVKQLEAKQPEAAKADDGARTVLEVILAIIIPPVGVLVHEGTLNSKFWISLLLTLLFYFPGMIYSLLVVLDVV